ncbi:hypothetical protein [Sphaerimonospora mesophila]|uniref:hypothetical protein n=1 Tax=Sphaerimonospora mesophila TaxID=37483 RepID=UPI000ABF0406
MINGKLVEQLDETPYTDLSLKDLDFWVLTITPAKRPKSPLDSTRLTLKTAV